ncbi:MAG: M20 family metallopeptidase, partial [Candidatus Dormibacteraceae bacterium]
NPYDAPPDGQLTGEQRLAEWVANWLETAGLEVDLQEVLPQRPNVVARLKGRDSSRALLLSGHLDTVGISGMSGDPYSCQLRNGRLYGRGACDAKGSLAAFMLALRGLVVEGIQPPIDVVLSAVVDEEHLARGTQHFLSQWDPGCRIMGAVIGLPTELAVITSHKGVFRFKIKTSGRSAHTAMPWEGDNAIDRMNQVMNYIREEVVGELNRKNHPLVGRPSIMSTEISGGQAINEVPHSCELTLTRWLIPGEATNLIWPRYKVEIEGLIPGRIEVGKPDNICLPMNTPGGVNLIRSLTGILDRYGLESEPVGGAYASDGGYLSQRGISCLLFGPGAMSEAHQPNESIELRQVATATKLIWELAIRFEEWDR